MTLPLTELSRKEIQSIIEKRSRDRISTYLENRGRWNFARSLTNLTEETSHEYGDRFLVELIQNAYDAHQPDTADGAIRILLDETEGSFGVLYVGNSGRPFTAENFEALSNIAQSDKVPGEGIGNKGIGFRSVLQVSEDPEVYSTLSRLPGKDADGFCFGFAKEGDLRHLTDSEENFNAVREDLTRYLLPVPIPRGNVRIHEILDDGCVTVLRMPLKNAHAREVAREQLKLAVAVEPPVLLFLDRLRIISITRVRETEAEESTLVERISREASGLNLPAEVFAEEVEIQGNRFLVFRQTIERQTVRRAVEESIEVGALGRSWSKWDTEAEVSIAVACDSDTLKPVMFSFLPMEAPAPMHGFLNAPFYTKLARVELDYNVPLNSFLIDRAADLCVTAISALKDSSRVDRFAAVCDLLTWDGEHIQRLRGAFQRMGTELEDAFVVPAIGQGSELSWDQLGSVFIWNKNLQVMNAQNIASQASVPIVGPSLGTDRFRRLNELRKYCLGNEMDPNHDIIANWAEAIAKHLQGNRFDPDHWNAYYGDLEALFSQNASVLKGRKILIDSQKRVLPAGPWDRETVGESNTTVFFPPRRKTEQGPVEDEVVEDEEDIEVPPHLSRAITYLHGDIALTKQEGSRRPRNEVRDFLEQSRLVLPYRRRTLIDHVSKLLLRTKSDRTHREALFWAYRQFEATKEGIPDLKILPLRLPTSRGWVPAKIATFGRGWPNTIGVQLADLLEALPDRDEHARELDGHLVLHPESWLPATAQVHTWTSFLKSIGVKDGLFPLAQPNSRLVMKGQFYSVQRVSAELGIHPAIAAQWKSVVTDPTLNHPYTPYRTNGELWVLPGQLSYTELNRKDRELFAGILLQSIGAWPEECLEFTFSRFRSADHRRYPDKQTWPSLAWAFVCAESWVPMADPRRRSDTYFTKVIQAWHHDDSAKETAPRFARLIPPAFRRRINDQSLQRLKTAGLRTWNDPWSATDRLAECAKLVIDGHLTEGDAWGIRRACKEAWQNRIDLDSEEEDLELIPLVVSRGHKLAVVPSLEKQPESPMKVFVPENSRGIVTQVLEGLEKNILEVEAQHGDAVQHLLRTRHDLSIIPIEKVEARYIADGEAVTSEKAGPFLISAQEAWLVDVLLVVLDLQSSQFVRVTEQTLRRAAEKLRTVRVWPASKIEVEIDGEVLNLPSHAGRSVALDEADHPMIVATPSSQDLSWEVLESLSVPLAEIAFNRVGSREIALSCIRLGRQLDGAWRKPSSAEIAKALELPRERVEDTLKSLKRDLATAVENTAAVVAHFEGLEAAQRLLDEMFEDEESLLKAIAALPNLPIPSRELVCISREAADLGEIRIRLKIDFADFNRTLRELGSPFMPISDAELHMQVLQHFVTVNRSQILEALRQRFFDDFEVGKPLDEYLVLSRLDQLEVPKEWPEIYESPPKDLMTKLINDWLGMYGAPPMGSCTRELVDLDELRCRNESFVEKALPKLSALVRAWCEQKDEDIPSGWLQQEDNEATPRSTLRTSGHLDFIEIKEAQLIAWLATNSFWPVEMPQTTELEVLGLDPDALDQAKHEREAHAQRETRSVILDGEQLDASEGNYHELVGRVRATVDEDFLKTPKQAANLVDIGSKGTRSGGSGGRIRGPRERLTKEQRNAVGLVGEVLAYAWLQNRYPSDITPDSWMSGYRGAVLGGHEGDDSLGYDFEVVQNSRTLKFEVKATSTDDREFQLTESELLTAQSARRGTYQIIFICNVLDSKRRTLHVLPNPFEEHSRKKYRVMNEGLRFRFHLEK